MTFSEERDNTLTHFPGEFEQGPSNMSYTTDFQKQLSSDYKWRLMRTDRDSFQTGFRRSRDVLARVLDEESDPEGMPSSEESELDLELENLAKNLR